MVALGDHAGVLNISPYPIAQTEAEPNLYRACQTWVLLVLVFLWKHSYAIWDNTVIEARS